MSGREHIVGQTVFLVSTLFHLHLICDYKDRYGEKKHIWSHTNQDFMYEREKCVAICLGYLEHFSILA